ncbi:phosphate acyltransferase PlsX [Pelagibacteraceae bacterium]|nr:phosphate acyltransferase PlsX [Pelagibacteraceae bacterium]
MDTINLAVDCMGSETSLNEILEGINESALRNENLFFTLFGKLVDLNKIVENISPLNARSKIINCDEQVLMTDKPTDAIRLKKNSSMQLSIDHVACGKSNAVLSCGNTGALMAISLLKLRTVASIKRPSIASIWPNLKGESIVLDLGANIKNDTNSLIDNAILGSALAKVLFSMTEPSVGLLNVGIEDMKGNENVQKASEILLEMSNKKQLNYYGFVEGADISNGITNVIVTDGFTGNIALKTAEGTASMVQSYFKKAFESSILSKIGYFFASLSLKSVRQRLDPRVHNCGIFMGLTAPVVKCHGKSDRLGISYATDIAYSLVHKEVNKKVENILINEI